MPFVGKNVRELRAREEFTLADLASLMGLSSQQIDHYEKGLSQPKIEPLDRLYEIARQRGHYDLVFYEPPMNRE